MSKLATRCSAILISSGLVGLLTACPATNVPTTDGRPGGPNVVPIPSALPTAISPTQPPGSVIVTPTPFPSGAPGQPSASPGGPLPSTTPGELAISTTTLPTAVLDFNYNFGLQVVGGSGSYRWSVVTGNLPNGLTLDQATGQIFGRPTQTGSFSFEAQVIDNQRATVARRNFFILVSDTDSGLNSLAILSGDLPSGTVDRVYSRQLEVSGGTAPFSWNITAGALPDGLDLNTSTGEISGTPTLTGEETFSVRVTDARGASANRTLSITINRTDTDLAILTASLPLAVAGDPYKRTACGEDFFARLQATGGDGDYRWTISREESAFENAGFDLADGEDDADVDDDDAIILGTPNTAGTVTFTVRVQDGEDNSASKVFTIETRDLLIHDFSPEAGSEDLRVVLRGENLNAAIGHPIFFGGVAADTVVGGDVSSGGSCDTLETHVPNGAKVGALSVQDGNDVLGSSEKPFVPENVVISEVFTSPANGEFQFVELRNRGTSSVSLAGWVLSYTGTDGALVNFELPSGTPPLGAGRVTTVRLRKGSGASASATEIQTGPSVQEMRFDPANASDSAALTQIALCADDNCFDDGSDTNYRDYLQFGAGDVDGGDLENDAVNVGLWSENATLDVSDQMAQLDTVSDDSADDDAAHFGAVEDYAKAGLLLEDGNSKFGAYSGDAVFYFTPGTGSPSANVQQRLLRGVEGVGSGAQANRVILDTPLFEAQIQSTNTGNGTTGNGILVNSISLFTPGDLVNVILGNTIGTISALSTTGPRVELSQAVAVNVDAANNSDGVVNGGLLVPADILAFLRTGQSLNIMVRNTGDNPFSVTRTLNSINTSTNRLVLNQALASVTVAGANEGDGTPANEIELTTTPTQIQAGDQLLYKGANCVDRNPCVVEGVSGNLLRLAEPVGLEVHPSNTGDGTEGNGITVYSTAGLEETDVVLLNGDEYTIEAILPAFTSSEFPRVELGEAVTVSDGDIFSLVPDGGSFTLVPDDTTAITLVPNSGSIYFAPTSGSLRKYQSIFFLNTSGQNDGDYDLAEPTPGQ
ncbi:MAG: putative Ig domain-containing protein [Candidatus Sericytochromatia bacterium]